MVSWNNKLFSEGYFREGTKIKRYHQLIDGYTNVLPH